MAGVFLCLKQQCAATSRYIENPTLILSKKGEHYGHEYVELSDLQDTMQPYLGQFSENFIDAVVQMVNQMTQDMKKSNAILVDKLANDLQLYIQSKAQVQVTNLVRAILQNDQQYLRDNQDQFELLRNPGLIFQSQQKNFTEMIEKVNQLQEQLAVHCLNNSSLLPLENEQNVRQENERKLINLQKQFDIKVNETTAIINRQKHELEDKRIREIKYQQQLKEKQIEINVLQQQFSHKKNQLDTYQNAEANRLAIETDFNWCSTNQHDNIILNGKTATSKISSSLRYIYRPAIVLQPRLNLGKSQSIKLKITKIKQNSRIKLHICDLRKIKKECREFIDIYESCAFTLDSEGNAFKSDLRIKTKGFKFGLNDIVKLLWNGPQMQLTTLKVNTNEKFVYDVVIDSDAEIHFAVSFNSEDAQIQIV